MVKIMTNAETERLTENNTRLELSRRLTKRDDLNYNHMTCWVYECTKCNVWSADFDAMRNHVKVSGHQPFKLSRSYVDVQLYLTAEDEELRDCQHYCHGTPSLMRRCCNCYNKDDYFYPVQIPCSHCEQTVKHNLWKHTPLESRLVRSNPEEAIQFRGNKRKSILQAIGLTGEVKRIEAGKCPTCGNEIDPDDFNDDLSRKEWRISGMCQKCQDGVFGGEQE